MIERLLEGDVRPPVAGYLNYPPGAATPNPLMPMGPNTFNEWLWPVTIERTPKPGVIITDMALDKEFFDAPGLWRERAMNQQLHSGELVTHPRTRDVTGL